MSEIKLLTPDELSASRLHRVCTVSAKIPFVGKFPCYKLVVDFLNFGVTVTTSTTQPEQTKWQTSNTSAIRKPAQLN